MKINLNHPLRKGLCFAQLFDCLICTLLLGTILAAIFSVSAIFPDKLIDAKYFFTWGMSIITCITIALRIVCTKKRLPLQTYYKFNLLAELKNRLKISIFLWRKKLCISLIFSNFVVSNYKVIYFTLCTTCMQIS